MQSFLAFQRVGAPDLISPTRGTSVRPYSDDAVTMQWRPGCAVVLCKLNSLNAPQQLPAWFLTATIFPRKKVVFITFSLVSWPCDFLKKHLKWQTHSNSLNLFNFWLHTWEEWLEWFFSRMIWWVWPQGGPGSSFSHLSGNSSSPLSAPLYSSVYWLF